MSDIALDVLDLSVQFPTDRGIVQAVSGVSFALHAGETLGIVGESGSGKSVTSLATMGLLDPRFAHVEAAVLKVGDHDVRNLSERAWRAIRGREIAMIFQDPMTALNPFLTIERQMSEVLELHENATRKGARSRVVAALSDVGIADPEARAAGYPHEMSGGMRQRVGIAMALLAKPRVLIADEPTTALDVTVQAQILELLHKLQAQHGTAILLITHSLGVVAEACNRTSVMYAGRIVESATTEALFARPLHPYTRGLLASVPRLDGNPYRRLASIEGQPPAPGVVLPGCAFAPRCEWRRDRCERERPELERFVGRSSACFESRALSGAGE
ncbi:MAG: ABC transporter ATP-binding protein [Planctomycetes bacterium]|nr:ABC transporter ATP-binding protein [Planctomycetota bacterium]